MPRQRHTPPVVTVEEQSPEPHDGLIATPARAAEIAAMDEFDLHEFIELTGVGAGIFGNYQVTTKGVTLVLANSVEDANLGSWNAAEQLVILRARQRPTLSFPCSPEAFMSWYDANRGERKAGKPVPSDFPLVAAFESVMRRRDATSSDRDRASVPSIKIIDAFAVKTDPTANAAWWRARLSDPQKYGGASLVGARARRGNPKTPFVGTLTSWLDGWLNEGISCLKLRSNP